jgi:hypothetical protein
MRRLGGGVVNSPIDSLHAECLLARNRTRHEFTQAKERASRWELGECPAKPFRARRLTGQQAAWFEAYTGVDPRALPRPEFYYGDDPLLTKDRKWLR